jgi:hypothetical protein
VKQALLYAWAAGVIDGEGCISIIRTPPTAASRCVANRYTLHLKVTMGHEQTVKRLRRIFRTGSVQIHVPKSERLNASWSWVCQSRQSEHVLRLVRPYLLTKAKEADVGMRFLRLPLAKRGGYGGGHPTPPALTRQRERLYWRLRKLKSRWRFYNPTDKPVSA